MKKSAILFFLIFYFACTPNLNIKPDSAYIVPAEVNYRKYFKSNYKSLDTLEGVWIEYDDNGQLLSKDNYKNGNKDSPWDRFWSGIFNDGKKISD